MADRWFYAVGDERRGPVEKEELLMMIRDGRLRRSTLIWTRALTDWAPAGEVAELAAAWPAPAERETAPPIPKVGRSKPPISASVFHDVGRKLSLLADLPTISRMPVREIFVGGLSRSTKAEDMEETFAVGTLLTTPPLSAVADGWPVPRVFWRVLGGALVTYFLLRLGVTEFGNPNFVPGLIVIGSFVMPLSVVILFFELNTPKNVSVYQVGKLLLLGGALSLILTSLVARILPGSGVGDVVPAMLTGVVEETGKALALLIVIGNPRYRWQLNGLLFGAAVGAGFAGFESAGYAYTKAATIDDVLTVIQMRGMLAPGGHVIWTAMVGSAIWKVKGDKPFEVGMLFSPVVLRRWGIAVVLHGLWDTAVGPPWVKWALLSVIGWYFVLGILTQGLDEVAAAKKGAVQAG
ncbi:MAG: PrsW family glutamic-type intramembrane protease [Thermoanaerobaculia bacterium]